MAKTGTAMSTRESGTQVAGAQKHYEVWASTPTCAAIVGSANTLLGALMLYARVRRTEPNRTISVLVNGPAADRGD